MEFSHFYSFLGRTDTPPSQHVDVDAKIHTRGVPGMDANETRDLQLDILVRDVRHWIPSFTDRRKTLARDSLAAVNGFRVLLLAAFSRILSRPVVHSPVLRIVFIVWLLVLPNLRMLFAESSILPPNSDITGIAGKKDFAKERAATLKRAEKDARFSDKKSNLTMQLKTLIMIGRHICLSKKTKSASMIF